MTPLDLATHIAGLTEDERITFLNETNQELNDLDVSFRLAGKPGTRTGDPGN